MTKARSGSYEAGPLSDREGERLRAQAAVTWGRERSALARAGLVEGARLLDVGCGPGGVLAPLAADLGRTPFGIDVNQAFLRRARPCAHVARADGAALPFADGTFDFVLLRLVLRHAPERARLLAEAARVTRIGGTVAAVDVDEEATASIPNRHSGRRSSGRSSNRRGGVAVIRSSGGVSGAC
jgi:ubiquinone/menaquinone biosynthesis C-methylase UbiE